MLPAEMLLRTILLPYIRERVNNIYFLSHNVSQQFIERPTVSSLHLVVCAQLFIHTTGLPTLRNYNLPKP